MERDNVGSLRQIHDDWVFRTVGAVVFTELSAQPPGLNAHHGIELGIEIIRATENLCRNLIFLDRSSGMIEGMFCQIAKEFAQRLRAMEDVAAYQLFYLL